MGSGLFTLQEPPGRRRTDEAKLGLSEANEKWRVGIPFAIPHFSTSLCCRALATRAIKSNERLVPVSFTRRRASTSGLSTWWSSTALQGELVLRLVSRLDAFSGYPFRI